MFSSAYTTLKILGIRKETADTTSFILQEVSGREINYKAGQFLTLVFPGRTSEERRSYSISSTPLLQERLTITVKRIDNGEFSRILSDTSKPGDLLHTIGASGFFTLPENITTFNQVIFLAAGSGITPILPLIKTILYTHPSLKVFLIYSNRAPETTIFLKEIRALAEKFPESFHVEFLFSSAKDLFKARLGKLLLAKYLDQWVPLEKERSLFYLCGPHDYMQMISITLLTEGVPAENIRKEIFDTVKPVVKELPPDQAPHRVTLHYLGREHTLMVQYPVSILEAAKRAGINLPYSCEAGKCGTCSATCLNGKVWMSYNEVLLDKELEQGRVLTCTGYPVAGDVHLDFPEI